MEPSRIPNKLRMCRRACGYSQKKVARMLNLSDTSSLSRWEHGISLPAIMQVFHLAHIYHMLPHEIFDELWRQSEAVASLLAQNTEQFNDNHSSMST